MSESKNVYENNIIDLGDTEETATESLIDLETFEENAEVSATETEETVADTNLNIPVTVNETNGQDFLLDLGDEGFTEDRVEKPNPLFFAIKLVGAILAVVCVVCFFIKCKGNDSDDDNVISTEPTMTTSTTVQTEASTISVDDFIAMLEESQGETEIFETGIRRFKQTDRDTMTSIKNCIGRIIIDGTLVDGWVVQAQDNSYYLDKDIKGNTAKQGSLFGDYRNDFENLNSNNVIYGHNMADGGMFGTLTRLREEDFYKDGENVYIDFNTLYYNNMFVVYSVYEIDLVTFNYIQTGFANKEDFKEFYKKTASFNSVKALDDVPLPENPQILTLSTCTQNGTKRLVVHAYLYDRGVA